MGIIHEEKQDMIIDVSPCVSCSILLNTLLNLNMYLYFVYNMLMWVLLVIRNILDHLVIYFQLLKANGESINGNEIILVSDGKNTVSPAIDDVRDEILAANVIVTTVAIGNLADKDMEKLAKDTGGSSHFYSGEMQSTALSDSFVKFAECTSDEESKMHQVSSMFF